MNAFMIVKVKVISGRVLVLPLVFFGGIFVYSIEYKPQESTLVLFVNVYGQDQPKSC